MVSVIIIYTRDDQLNLAKEWLDKQTGVEIETIILDNRGNCAYSSAAAALNDGAKRAKGEYLIFMHQDVYLWDTESCAKYASFLESHPDAIIGIAGVAKDGRGVRYDLWQTQKKYRFALPANGEIIPAKTLDECMFAMTKKRWEELKFDEVTCDNWHFYGADICYANQFSGGENFLVPLEVCHDSLGTPEGKSFHRSVKRMIKKYRGKLEEIETTCIRIRCGGGTYLKYLFREKCKSILKLIGLYDNRRRRKDARLRKRGKYVPDYDEIEKAKRGE